MSAGVARAVAAVLGSTSVLLWLMCMYIVARSGFSTDPQGYALIFGTVVGVLAGGLSVVVLPAAFPESQRRRALRIWLLLLAGPTVALYLGLALT